MGAESAVPPQSSSATLAVGCFFVWRGDVFGKRIGLIPRFATIRWLCLSLLVVLLAGCAASASPTEPAPTVPAPASTTLILWHGWSAVGRQALGRLVDRFNQQHPSGRVILQSIPLASFDTDLRAALASGGGPHMVLMPNSWVGALAEKGALLPLDDLVAASERQALLPAAVGGAQARGADGTQRLYGLPISTDTLALFYDKRNLLRAPEDTDTLISNAHGLGDPAAPRWGLAFNLSLDNTIGYLYAADGRIFDDKGALVLGSTGRAGAERWLSWLKQLHDDPQLLARSDSSIEIDRELKGGRVLISVDWAHQLGFYRSLWGENMGVAQLPRLAATNQPPQPYLRSDVLAINSRAAAAERAAALAFLAYMTSAEAQAVLLQNDIQPARDGLNLNEIGLDAVQVGAADVFRNQGRQALPMPNSPTRDLVRRELAQLQRQVLRGDASPADAITETDTRLREQLGTAQP